MCLLRIIPLSKWPLTANGKTDKHKIQQMQTCYTYEESHQDKTNDVEEKILAIIKSLLQADNLSHRNISITENFMSLGLDSFMMVMFSQKLSEKLNCPINITALFTYPTIKSLATHVQSIQQKQMLDDSFSKKLYNVKQFTHRKNRIRFSDET